MTRPIALETSLESAADVDPEASGAGAPRKPDADALAERELFRALRGEGDAEARRELVDRHQKLVRIVAAQLFARRPDGLADFDDYLHYGMVGLLEALDRFDAERGVRFSTFASHRVRGAILNGLSKLSEQRELRAHQARVRADRVRSLREEKEAEGGRGEGEDEFAELVDITIGLSIGLLLEMAEREADEREATRTNPYARCAALEAGRGLEKALATLPEREHLVLRYHYFQHIPFSEIARMFDVTKGRISQIHSRALRRLRESYEAARPLDGFY